MIEVIGPKRLTLPDGVLAGISTRSGGVSRDQFASLNLSTLTGDSQENVKRNRALLLGALGIDENRLVTPQQIHSATVQMIDQPGNYPATDALITPARNVFLSVFIADCHPILIWADDGEWLAAVHAGWRGTEQQILSKTLALILSSSGYELNQFKVWVGPGLGRCHFQVGPEFATKFKSKYLEHRLDGLYFNHAQANVDQALAAGVPMENIESSNECSFCESHKYFSHRRDQGKTGRMLAIIGRIDS